MSQNLRKTNTQLKLVIDFIKWNRNTTFEPNITFKSVEILAYLKNGYSNCKKLFNKIKNTFGSSYILL